jgi:hypothetical protein
MPGRAHGMSPDHPDKTSLIHEIGSGPGYFVHAGENKGHAVIVKVFNAGPNVREVRRLISRNSISRLSNIRRRDWIPQWLYRRGLCECEVFATMAFIDEIRHPNVLRIEGISSPASLTKFIAYENCRRFVFTRMLKREPSLEKG